MQNYDLNDYLHSARTRGDDLLQGMQTPAGLVELTTYVGLISNALELAKVVKTESRDLEAIRTYYTVEVQKLEAAFTQVELALRTDAARDQSLLSMTMPLIDKLIAAGNEEMALTFYDRMLNGFSGSALDKLLGNTGNSLGTMITLHRDR